MVRARKVLAVLVATFGAGLVTCSGGDSGSLIRQPEVFRALVYSQGMADRFKLPAKAAIELGPGIEAIAITVEPDAIGCSLWLYLDDSVPFAYPPGQEARLEDLHPQTGPLFFGDMSESDYVGMMKRMGDLAIVYRSRVYGTAQHRGAMHGGTPSAFWRSLLPRLNIVRFDAACDVLDPENAPADIWLLREGNREMTIAPNEQQAIRIPVPESLLREAAPATKRAASMPVDVRPTAAPKYSVPGSVASPR